MKLSPIIYNGSKKRILKKLISYFPKNINTFYDLFSGSAIVSMNVFAKKYVLNDNNPKVIELYRAFRLYSHKEIISHIRKRIVQYNLPVRITHSKSLLCEYKKNFLSLKDYYNKSKNKNILDLITLMYFSFSKQFRFNSKNYYNSAYGVNKIFTEENSIKNGCFFFNKENVFVHNKDFSQINFRKLNKNDFVYLDPPYLNTEAVYNVAMGTWTKKDDKKLFNFCEELNKNGIKFGLSNVFSCRGKENKHLIKWCTKNNWYVKHIKINYCPNGKGLSNADEVFITNYSTEIKGTFD